MSRTDGAQGIHATGAGRMTERRTARRLALVLAGAALLLAGCPAPGLTGNPLDTPDDGPPVVSVCYRALFTDRAEAVEPVAREACAEAGVPDAALEFWKKTVILNDCPLLKKSRAAYFCGQGGAAKPASPAGSTDTGTTGSPD